MNIPLLLVIAVTVGAVVFGVMTLVTGGDPGLRPAEPDSRARPLPGDRPLLEGDVGQATFDVALRGYRMDQVDQTLRRLAYDIGYKTELIQVLEAEIIALRDGRLDDADTLSQARLASLAGPHSAEPEPQVAEEDEVTDRDFAISLDRPAGSSRGDSTGGHPSGRGPDGSEHDGSGHSDIEADHDADHDADIDDDHPTDEASEAAPAERRKSAA